ncbi:hypothetical protein F7725_029140 [Dissostichus mawsoni]|uniref:Uncharacterized protein n=1 Tax=Dissostichus mawsoni TaxID=36200 RepID=A0A7J5XHK4_DISMA|nr:hypothetical protein F7725_029140 [Dissostichus mawsoni]
MIAPPGHSTQCSVRPRGTEGCVCRTNIALAALASDEKTRTDGLQQADEWLLGTAHKSGKQVKIFHVAAGDEKQGSGLERSQVTTPAHQHQFFQAFKRILNEPRHPAPPPAESCSKGCSDADHMQSFKRVFCGDSKLDCGSRPPLGAMRPTHRKLPLLNTADLPPPPALPSLLPPPSTGLRA